MAEAGGVSVDEGILMFLFVVCEFVLKLQGDLLNGGALNPEAKQVEAKLYQLQRQPTQQHRNESWTIQYRRSGDVILSCRLTIQKKDSIQAHHLVTTAHQLSRGVGKLLFFEHILLFGNRSTVHKRCGLALGLEARIQTLRMALLFHAPKWSSCSLGRLKRSPTVPIASSFYFFCINMFSQRMLKAHWSVKMTRS
jgi:hypothetical protein